MHVELPDAHAAPLPMRNIGNAATLPGEHPAERRRFLLALLDFLAAPEIGELAAGKPVPPGPLDLLIVSGDVSELLPPAASLLESARPFVFFQHAGNTEIPRLPAAYRLFHLHRAPRWFGLWGHRIRAVQLLGPAPSGSLLAVPDESLAHLMRAAGR